MCNFRNSRTVRKLQGIRDRKMTEAKSIIKNRIGQDNLLFLCYKSLGYEGRYIPTLNSIILCARGYNNPIDEGGIRMIVNILIHENLHKAIRQSFGEWYNDETSYFNSEQEEEIYIMMMINLIIFDKMKGYKNDRNKDFVE